MKGIALASVVIAVVLFATVSALANHVTPVTVGPGNEGNPKCPAGLNSLELQSDAFTNGSHSDNDGPLTVTISNFDGSSSAKTFDWTSNIGVDVVIVKGGDYANIYTYSPESKGDTGLHTPPNQNNGQNYGLSHVLFCYDVESPPPSESPSPSVSPSETETPSSSPSVSPSETESTSPSVSVLPTSTSTASVLGKKLTRTGADVIRLALFALALLALGVLAYVIATRSSRKNA